MAKQLGIQFTGTIDGLSFYRNSLHGYLVRKTGGVTSKQYHKEDRYAAARDASLEFAAVSKAGKLIRTALAEFIAPVKDGSMVNRLNKELVALKQLDNKHDRGKRRPETRITDPEANKWFRIFQFNDQVKLYDLLEHYTTGNTVYRVPTLRREAFPESATHAGLTLVKTIIDFEKGTFKIHSSNTITVSKECREEIPLETSFIPFSEGIEITCLQVIFFCEEHGQLVQLAGKSHAMGILDVRKTSLFQPSARQRRKINKRRKKAHSYTLVSSVKTLTPSTTFLNPSLRREIEQISFTEKEMRRAEKPKITYWIAPPS